ncbi:hypothetical protein N7491_006316 [Penicillium cf. griseofulvum]|uniref:Uncharacterized protein n=1 Tax=Penicillium cf. griseofulvum TaxID=2972120 RepID=A0A9W9M3B9_9EURO|nr:hypothetical protein N7472_010652 [Penicillium cf. griseofulvum]KAJ5429300.1 hypothetical protein N7491_006316 [Penicillium cf. griseofulvum]
MTSPSSTILIDDDELPPTWPLTDLRVLVELNNAAGGSIELSRKRKRAEGKRSDSLDTCFKKLRKIVD